MRFHLIAASLFSLIGGILYFIISGVQADFDAARTQIHQEAVQSVQKKRVESLQKPVEEKNETASVAETRKEFNPAIFKQAPPQVAAIEEKAAPSGVMIEKIGNDEFWCRDQVEARNEKKPVRCSYPSACYGCVGSTVIPPDSESVVPFCDNGKQSQVFSIECCPRSVTSGVFECPSPRECLHADAVPESFCTCEGRPECRYLEIAGQVQCMCSQ